MHRAKKATNKIKPQAVAALVVVLMLGGFFLWPTQASVGSLPPVAQPVAAVATLAPTPTGPIVAHTNCEVAKCLALTFDDGPDAAITPRILDILKQHNAKATFFVLGGHVAGNEAILQRIHAEGHEIGNHSWNHPRFTQLSVDQMQTEVLNTQAAIIKAGVPAPTLFRPPYGDVNDVVLAQIPLSVVRWNIDPEDWHPKRQNLLLEHMAAHARPGSVVVVHDTEVTTADKLDSLLAQLESQQFVLATVSDVLSLSPGQRGVYFAR